MLQRRIGTVALHGAVTVLLQAVNSACPSYLRQSMAVLSKHGYATAAARLHFCIVGAGPAGFYTADKVRNMSMLIVNAAL